MCKGQVLLSKEKVNAVDLAMMYNLADATINVSDAEGFGLSTLESLSCGTPIIATLTGGLQDQIKDGEDNWYGIGLEPSSKSIIGSQEVPFIYEDRLAGEDVVQALTDMYKMPEEQRREWGLRGRAWAEKQFGFETFVERWDNLFTHVHETMGSWENRTGYNSYEVKVY